MEDIIFMLKALVILAIAMLLEDVKFLLAKQILVSEVLVFMNGIQIQITQTIVLELPYLAQVDTYVQTALA
jgi:hypothetical protein